MVEKYLKMIEECDKSVLELKTILKKYSQHQLSMVKINQQMTGIIDKFYSNSPVKLTQEAVSKYTEIHSLFDTSTTALFHDGIDVKIWKIFKEWEVLAKELKEKLECYESV